jgi:hypothetical protein
MSTAWPLVVGFLVDTLPTLPGWGRVEVYDTDPLTASGAPLYAVVARTSDSGTSGSYVRQVHPGGVLVAETGTVRVHIVSRTGDGDPVSVREAGFELVEAMEATFVADHTLGGILGQASSVSLTVDVQSLSDANGTGQSLIVSINYYALI